MKKVFKRSKKEVKTFFLMHFAFFIYSITTLIGKTASTLPFFSFQFFLLFFGLVILMVLYAFLWQIVLKNTQLSIAYANKSVVLLWVFFWSIVFLKETITLMNVLGSLIIILGICLVSLDE